MKITEIRKLQVVYGYDKMQNIIETGAVWHMEGSLGREAMHLLELGACFLPRKARRGAYGQTIPSRSMVEAGTKGTLQNSIQFYENN
jgi:hypothetical protein